MSGRSLTLAACLAVLRIFAGDPTGTIACEGTYPYHPQGVATDGTNVYWSFTTVLVKTDLTGKLLATYAEKARGDGHIGDLCCRGGHVFAGINRGFASDETRPGDEVWEFDGGLGLVRKYPTPETIWCNNGLEWFGGSFWIVASAPDRCAYNFVFEYTPEFKFRRCLPIASGWTMVGVQTILHYRDRLLFGHYGAPRDKTDPHQSGLFVVDTAKLPPYVATDHPAMVPCEKRIPGVDTSCGMMALNGKFYRLSAREIPAAAKGARPRWTACVIPFDIDRLL